MWFVHSLKRKQKKSNTENDGGKKVSVANREHLFLSKTKTSFKAFWSNKVDQKMMFELYGFVCKVICNSSPPTPIPLFRCLSHSKTLLLLFNQTTYWTNAIFELIFYFKHLWQRKEETKTKEFNHQRYRTCKLFRPQF